MEIDFWSLGVMIKEMLTGKLPWEGAEQRGNSTIFRKVGPPTLPLYFDQLTWSYNAWK